jgi:energy-converting hydrogenase A subunit R
MNVFDTDLEGPWSKDDNAFDLSTYYIEDGDKFFSLISKIDDVWADNIVQPNYKAGDTLRLILPFLKAYGATSKGMEEFSAEHLHLLKGSIPNLQYIGGLMSTFIISTSYEPYVSAICETVGFPVENVYCTEVDIDSYPMPERERKKIMDHRKEIVEMPMIEIPKGARKLEDFPLSDQESIKRLYEIFWKVIPSMECGRMLKDVSPVGGWGKAEAVKDIVERTGRSFSDTMYVGDSITDRDPLRLVREGGGLTISFNGNDYVIREAEVAVMSDNTAITSVIATVFNQYGRKGVIDFVKDWDSKLPRVKLITDENRDRLAKESSIFRKTVRGQAVGKLG